MTILATPSTTGTCSARRSRSPRRGRRGALPSRDGAAKERDSPSDRARPLLLLASEPGAPLDRNRPSPIRSSPLVISRARTIALGPLLCLLLVLATDAFAATHPAPCPTPSTRSASEACLRTELGIPQDAKRVVIVSQSSHL